MIYSNFNGKGYYEYVHWISNCSQQCHNVWLVKTCLLDVCTSFRNEVKVLKGFISVSQVDSNYENFVRISNCSQQCHNVQDVHPSRMEVVRSFRNEEKVV